MNLSLTKKILVSLLGLGVVGSLVGMGTFASFTAQTTNPSNTFATGTLVLSNQKNAATACLSTAGGTTDSNANGACDTLFTLATKKPTDSSTVNLTLKNEGTLAASALKVYSASCANDNASGESYRGTGLMCGKVQVYIQEYSDSGRTTVSACRYGGAAVANTCDFSDTTKTLAAFQTAFPTLAQPLTLTGGMSAGGSRYFTIGVKMPDADNTFQGRVATQDFVWHIEQ